MCTFRVAWRGTQVAVVRKVCGVIDVFVSEEVVVCCFFFCVVFFVQAEDGIRDLVRSRGLGDVYKRQDGVWMDDDVHGEGWEPDVIYPPCPFNPLACDCVPKPETMSLSLIHI